VKDPWTTLAKPNHCVVCGSTKKLNRHHVVPWSFLRHLPEWAKKHNSHDVLPTCTKCHMRYENFSNEKRKYFAELYGIPLSGANDQFRDDMYVRGLSRSLIEHGDKIPEGRKQVMMLLLESELGHRPTLEEIKEYAKKKPKPSNSGHSFGAQVVARISDFDEFARFWRQHFLDTMKPQHMPDYWRVDRKFNEDYDGTAA
jgi:protein-arginine kinase activator protein McsA